MLCGSKCDPSWRLLQGSLSRLCNSIVGMKSGDVSYLQLLLLDLTTPLLIFDCLLNMPISERQALESPSIVGVWRLLSLKFLYVFCFT